MLKLNWYEISKCTVYYNRNRVCFFVFHKNMSCLETLRNHEKVTWNWGEEYGNWEECEEKYEKC